jgi:hypothetical protein
MCCKDVRTLKGYLEREEVDKEQEPSELLMIIRYWAAIARFIQS